MGLMMKLKRTKAATDVYDPKTLEERRAVANRCEVALEYGIPTYGDEMDDAVNIIDECLSEVEAGILT